MKKRLIKDKIFKIIFTLSTFFALLILCVLLYRIGSQGLPYLNWDFFTSFASRRAENAGIKAAFFGTIWVMLLTAPISFILGVGTAIYLEEYATKGRFTTIVQMNISNLAGVPSIVFGLLGLTIFVRFLELERSILAGALTMSLLILPIIVVASQEALKTVPKELKEGAYGLGATKWQTLYRITLPVALPGILTGNILALSRAIGETAPLIVIGALSYIAFVPENIFSQFTVMPIQIYNWASRPQEAFHHIAASGIIVLMIMLFTMNAIAIYIRNKFSKKY